MFFKNTTNQGVYLLALTSSGSADTGDASNITCLISKDGAATASTATAHPTEIGGGIYWLPLSQAESNANALSVIGSSTTSGVSVSPAVIYTQAGTISTSGNLTGSVASVVGAVGSVTGAVGSVTGNLGGNVTGSVGSVTGAVGSVTGSVGGSVASVTGNLGGNVSGNVLGNVAGSVASVTNPVELDMTQAVPTGNTAQTLGDALNAARAQGFGKWTLTGTPATTLHLYAPDGTTIIRTFTLDSATAPTSRT